jgi:hypothetical protein
MTDVGGGDLHEDLATMQRRYEDLVDALGLSERAHDGSPHSRAHDGIQ